MAGNSLARRRVRHSVIGMLSLMVVMGGAVAFEHPEVLRSALGGLLPAPAPPSQS